MYKSAWWVATISLSHQPIKTHARSSRLAPELLVSTTTRSFSCPIAERYRWFTSWKPLVLFFELYETPFHSVIFSIYLFLLSSVDGYALDSDQSRPRMANR